MKKEKILKYAIYIAGAMCLFAFISVRSLPLYNLTLKEKLIPGYWDNTKYGECYYFNYIRDFREKGLPKAETKFQFSPEQAKLEETEIFTFGDSFFDISRGTQFPKLLSEKTSKKIHYVYQDLPLTYFARNNYKNTDKKILILGLAERYIPLKFSNPQTSDYYSDNRSNLRKMAASLKDLVFYQKSEELYDAMLKRSCLTNEPYTAIMTAKFKLFGYISKLTPKYYVDIRNPWLFYYDQVNEENTSFYYQHTDDEIRNICNNVRDLAGQLKEKYNIELVFLPIPAQYTLYHTVINQDRYSEFLPRLYQGLYRVGVNYINIFDNFRTSPDILYYGTDGHWNTKGINIAVDLVINYLNEHYDLNQSRIASTGLMTNPVKNDRQ